MTFERKQRLMSILCLTATLLLIAAAAAMGAPLHPSCPTPHGGFASSLVVGQRVLCLTDSVLAGKYELYSVAIASGLLVRLSPEMSDNRDVILFAASPDGQRVAFTCDARRWTTYELYSSPVAGGAAVRQNGNLPADYVVDTFVFSTDGARLIWRQGKTSSNDWALYSSAAGSPFGALRISQDMTLGGAVQQGFRAAGDHVHFVADAVVDERYESWVGRLTSQDVRPAKIFADGFESRGTGAWR